MRALALLMLVACPLSVLAEEEPSPPRWSLGGGVSTAVLYSTCTGTLNGGVVCPTSRGPSGSTSLERRLTDSSWLVLSASGTLSDSRQGSSLSGSSDVVTRWRTREVLLDLGLRHVLTGRQALVNVSVLAVAQGGYDETSGSTSGSPDLKVTSWIGGANVGVALDRELSPGLSLRVATPIAGVWWQQSRQRVSGSTVRGHAFTGSVYLAPRLELWMSF